MDGVQLAARAVAAPLVLGLRWLGPQRVAAPCPVESSWGARCKIVADEVFFLTEFLAGSSFAFSEGARVTAEVDEGLGLYQARGWLDDPASFHAEPPAIGAYGETEGFVRGVPFRRLRFESGYRPWPGEPGGARWLGYRPNRTAHVRLFQHHGPPRPWVVCVPGYRMGDPRIDWVGFGIGWLYRTLGLNVAIPVMPFHGERRCGRRGGDGYLAGDVLDTIHAQAQAVWDIRRLVRWLRASGAPGIGLYGVSLGGLHRGAPRGARGRPRLRRLRHPDGRLHRPDARQHVRRVADAHDVARVRLAEDRAPAARDRAARDAAARPGEPLLGVRRHDGHPGAARTRARPLAALGRGQPVLVPGQPRLVLPGARRARHARRRARGERAGRGGARGRRRRGDELLTRTRRAYFFSFFARNSIRSTQRVA
jgi:hypothetical protein